MAMSNKRKARRDSTEDNARLRKSVAERMAKLDAANRQLAERTVQLEEEITERKRAEAALRKSERNLAEANRQKTDILESISDCFYALDKHLRFLYVNQAAEKIWGLKRVDLIGRKIEDVFPGLIDLSLSKFRQVLEEQTPQEYEVYSKVIQRWGDMQVCPTPDGLAVYFQDTTERKRADEEITRLAKFPSENPNPILRLDSDGVILYANQGSAPFLGHWGSAVGTLAPEFWRTIVAQAHATQQNRTIDVEVGDRVYSLAIVPVADSNYVNLYGRDMTERKRAEEALQASQSQLQALVETTSDYIWEMDARGVYTYCSPQLQTLWGFDPKETIGKTPFDLVPPEDREPVMRAFSELAVARTAFRNLQMRSYDAAGHVKFLEISGVPFFDAAGELKGYRGITRDITDRKQKEEQVLELNRELVERAQDLEGANEELKVTNEELKGANEELGREIIERQRAVESLRLSEERFRFVLANSPVTLANVDRQLRYTWVYNPVASFKPEDILGKTPGLATDPETKDHMLKLLHDVVTQGASVRWETASRIDAGEKFFETRAEPLRDAQGEITGAAMVSLDITERKQAEETVRQTMHALQESQAELAQDLADAQRLQDISGKLIQEDNVSALYQGILDSAISLMRSEMGSLQVLDSQSNELELLGWKGFAPESAAFWERVDSASSGSCGAALRQGERVIVPDIEACEWMAGTRDLEHFHLSGIRAVQSTPLVSRGGQLLGMLSTHWREPHQPSERELRLLDVLARQAADLVERTQAEAALRESERKFSAIFQKAGFAAALTSLPEGVIVDVNEAWAKVFGHTQQEAIGKTSLQLGLNPDAEGRTRILTQLQTRGSVHDEEMTLQTKAGDARTMVANFDMVDIGGKKYILNTAQDITERKRAEDARRESEERYRMLFDSMQELFVLYEIVYDDQGSAVDFRFCEVNRAAEAATKTCKDQLVGKRLRELWPHMNPDHWEAMKRVAETGATVSLEAYGGVTGKFAQSHFWSPAKGLVATLSTDLTERKRAEEALGESEERLRLAQNYSGVGVWDWWPQTGTMVFSDEMNLLYGLPSGTVKSYDDWLSRVHPDDQAAMVAERDKALDEHKPFDLEYRILHASGQTRWIAARGGGVYDEAGQLIRVLGINIDITERKRAEEALRQRTEELQTIMEVVPTAVFITRDPDARTITGNRAARELVEMPPNINMSKSAPEVERPTGWQEMRGGVPIPPEDLPMQQAARGKQVHDYEMDLVFGDGTIKSVLGQATPLRDENGNPAGGIAVLIDVTERKRAAERIQKLNRDLEQRAGELEVANEELERLATSLAQDLRSPLVSLRGVARVLAQDYASQLAPQARQLFELIHANAEEMEDLTQGLVKLMQVTRQTLRKQDLDPAEIVRAAWAELEPRRVGHPAQVKMSLLPTCCADPLLLKQVWLNLLSNALQATCHEAQACIEIGGWQEGQRTTCFIKDNGVGFDMSYAGTIFRAFQRYHRPEEWEGSGVGLAIVESIVRRHGGRVWVESAVNEGATFYFEI